jgi:hypothetical protein
VIEKADDIKKEEVIKTKKIIIRSAVIDPNHPRCQMKSDGEIERMALN